MESASIAACMSKDYAIIHPEMPVVEASSRLIRCDILGSPVTDADGRLVGWISERECLQAALQVVYYNQRVANVQDVMQADVLAVSQEDDLLTLARQMLDNKPKIYPVVDESRRVLGVITRRHILNMIDANLLQQQLAK